MLRLFNQIGARFRAIPAQTRCFVTEAQKHFDEMDREKKIKIIELEISVHQQEGRKAPTAENLKPEHWDHILQLPSKSARKRYYQFLWVNEMRNIGKDEKKEIKKAGNALRLEKLREEAANNEHITYGIFHNTMFLRIYDSTITHYNNTKLMRSMMFDQKLIIDCSYDEYMNRMEATNAGKQLMLLFAENRLHDEPFDLHFCNFNPKSVTSRTLHRYIPTMFDDDFPMNFHSECLTEKFDKDKLVYLTPHCRNDLEEYSHDDIYIIGAMVDKTNNEPLSLAKAKKQGLRMARLPLDRYLDWGKSGKSLTLNQMVNIMLEMKKHGNWDKALKFVPRRKIVDPSQETSKQFQNFSFDRSRSYQQRQNFDDRRDSSFQPRESNQRFHQRQFPSYSSNFSSQRSRPNYDDHQDNDQRSFDKNRLTKERKHFDKFKFDLDTWGSKVKSEKGN